jgi:hypothetical protein
LRGSRLKNLLSNHQTRAISRLFKQSLYYRGFSPSRAKILDNKEVKYLAAAGKSGVADATA